MLKTFQILVELFNSQRPLKNQPKPKFLPIRFLQYQFSSVKNQFGVTPIVISSNNLNIITVLNKVKKVKTLMHWTQRVTEVDYQLKYAIFSTACSILYKYCTRPLSKHLYSGIFKDPLDTKHKFFKKRLNSYVIYSMLCFMLKLEYFFISCKT